MPLWPILTAILFLLLWYLISHFWADSVSHHQQILHDSVNQRRYGWRCPRCGKIAAPLCGREGCRGPLVWAGEQRRIICNRCGRHFIAHPWLFRETPIAWPGHCRECRWTGIVRHWDVG